MMLCMNGNAREYHNNNLNINKKIIKRNSSELEQKKDTPTI